MAREDQSDILKANEALTKDLSAVRGELETAKATILTLTGERDQHKAAAEKATATSGERDNSLSVITRERDALKADNDKLKASQEEFDKKVAAECLKHGVNVKALSQPLTSNKPLTATEKVMAAKAAK